MIPHRPGVSAVGVVTSLLVSVTVAPAQQAPARASDLVLLGVVIAGDTRLALLRDTRTSPADARLLRVGTSLAGLRLAEVQADRVILEAGGGERVTVRLAAGGGVAAAPPAAPGPARAGKLTPAQFAEARRALRAERIAQDRARTLAERAGWAGGQPPTPPTK